MAENSSMEAAKNLLIAGGTGPLGIKICKKLYASNIRFRMLVRDVSRAKSAMKEAGIPEDHVEFINGDITDTESLKRAFVSKDVGSVISSVGSLKASQVDGQGNCNLIDAAKDAGVENFILVSSTSVTRTWSVLNLFGLAKPKLRAENHLRASGMWHAVVRPPALTHSDGGVAAFEITQGDTLSMMSNISRGDVAHVVLNTFKAMRDGFRPSGGRGWTFEVGNIKSIPTNSSSASIFAPANVDLDNWKDVLKRLQPDS